MKFVERGCHKRSEKGRKAVSYELAVVDAEFDEDFDFLDHVKA